MAKKITYLATDPQGKVHKRTSESKVYTHCVAVMEGRQAVERRYANVAAFGEQAAASWDKLVREARGEFNKEDLWRGPKALEFFRDFAVKRLAQHAAEGVTRESYVATEIARAQERAEAFDKGGSWKTYGVVGWCSRLDLAMKLAAQHSGKYESVVILEAAPKA